MTDPNPRPIATQTMVGFPDSGGINPRLVVWVALQAVVCCVEAHGVTTIGLTNGGSVATSATVETVLERLSQAAALIA